jgi:ABC-type transporter Mla maintaining outer membrane lipid asymmetry permease subunit MlaE
MGISARLTTTASVVTTTRTTDGLGGFTTLTPSTVTSALMCRISMKVKSERDLGEQVKSKGDHTIFILATTTISPGMVLTADGRDYEILNVRRPSRGTHLELDAEDLENRV